MFFFTLGCNVMISWRLDISYTAPGVCVCVCVCAASREFCREHWSNRYELSARWSLSLWARLSDSNNNPHFVQIDFSFSPREDPGNQYSISLIISFVYIYFFFTSSDRKPNPGVERQEERKIYCTILSGKKRQEGSVRHAKGATGKYTICNSTSWIVSKIQHSFVCSINS